jgi:hypothetical protein
MSNPRSRTLESNEKEYATESKSQRAQGDIRFVPEVQHHKGAYVSVDESTKDWVSFNPKPPELSPRSIQFSSIYPHKEEGNINFPGLNHKLGSSWVTPRRLGECIPKSNKHNRGHRGRG